MASTTIPESLKTELPVPEVSQEKINFFDKYNPMQLLDRLHGFKEGLGLANPGTYEEIHRETKSNICLPMLLIEIRCLPCQPAN